MSRFRVWVIERDHEPVLGRGGRMLAFSENARGTAAMKERLNTFPTNDGHYYDAVLYQLSGKEKP